MRTIIVPSKYVYTVKVALESALERAVLNKNIAGEQLLKQILSELFKDEKLT